MVPLLLWAWAQTGACDAGCAAIERVQQQFPRARHWFRQVAGIRVDDVGGDLRPDWSTIQHPKVLRFDPAGQRLAPALPLRADGTHVIALDGHPEVWVRTTPLDAQPVPASRWDGIVAYAGAYGESDLLYKLTPTHVDEYVYVPHAGAPHRFRYRLQTAPGLSVELIAREGLEVVDAHGIARMRMAAPFARDAAGNRRDGTIELDGDVVTLDVDLDGLVFPVLIDPDWSTTGRMIKERFLFTLFTLPSGHVLAAAGCALTSCPAGLGLPLCNPVLADAEQYDPQSGTWRAAGALAQPRYAYMGISLSDGRALVAGGCIGPRCAGTTASVEIYDPQFDVWSPAPPLGSPRAYGTASAIAGERVLIAGGCDPVGCTNDVEIYDVRAGTWHAAAPMAQARGFHTATVLADGRVLVTGGCDSIACGGVLNGVELYDPVADSWSQPGDLGEPRASHTATLLADGNVLVAGGCSTAACQPTLQTAARFAPGGGWRSVGAMASPRHDHSASRLDDGTVLVAGGCVDHATCTKQGERFDPATDGWTATGPLFVDRGYHSTARLADGRMLLSGGCNAMTCLPWAETYTAEPLGSSDGGGSGGAGGSAGVPAAPGPGFEAEACGCRVGGRGPAGGWLLVLLLLARKRKERS